MIVQPNGPAPRDSLLRRFTGPLTRELLLTPGDYGLGSLPAKAQPDAVVGSVCGYCSTGCNLNIHLADGEAVNLSPSRPYPVNLGMACPKGWEALRVLDVPDRATQPLLRDATGARRPVSWETALRTFAGRLQAIQEQHGADSVAFLSTGQIVTEEMAFLGALAKFGMGVRHGDGNTCQCMATAVVAYKQAFGFDAPPYTYQDFEESDCLVLVGANLCIAHPIMWERVMRNRRNPEIVAVDPRRTETAMQSTQHLALYPKSDQALFYGLARLFIERDWIDHDFLAVHTTGFDEYARFVDEFTLERTAAETRLPIEEIEQFAEKIHQRRRVSFWWTMGVNQSYQGVRTAQAIINLALMTGNIGRPGTGANSITGQCNAMGSRLFSNTTSLLGGRDFSDASARCEVAELLDLDEAKIPTDAGWAYPEIMEGILRGKIRGLWIVATNPSHSWINQEFAREVLSRLDFLVVQDMYHSTETAQVADLLLPAAGWGEKDGTFINSERRIGRTRKVRAAPGKALSDYSIFRLIAEYWGCGERFAEWTSPEATFRLLGRLSADRPCDFSGVTSYAMLEDRGGVQWPYPAAGGDDRQERRLFEDGRFFTADQRAKFLFEAPKPFAEPVTEAFPLILLTGRGTASQWHTQTRTSKSDVLRKLYPASVYVEINPADARPLEILHNDRVWVESQRGRMVATAFVSPTTAPGQVFVPMHYPEVNRLTHPSFDPYSRQPSYKACSVRVRRVH